MLGAHALSTATVLGAATERDRPSAVGCAHVFTLLDVALEFRVRGLGRLNGLAGNRHNRLRLHQLRLLLLHHLLLLDYLLLLLHHLLLLNQLLLQLHQLLLSHLLLRLHQWLLLHLLHLDLLAKRWLSNRWCLTDRRESDWSILDAIDHWRLCLVSHFN